MGILYLFFKDNVNVGFLDVYKDKNMIVYVLNLCMEIMLLLSFDESFVCCLFLMNLFYFDEWKDIDVLEVLIYFLDVVMSEFIEKSNEILFLYCVNKFVCCYCVLGLGVLGWYSYL